MTGILDAQGSIPDAGDTPDVVGRWRPGRVSVVIPAYNAAETVGEAVASCLAQRHPDFEVIVVNDGSTDATGEVLASFGNRITVITQRNGGLASARNAGQRAASGEFLAWMDADDLAAPERLQVQSRVLEVHPEIGLVSSDFTAFTDPATDDDPAHWASYYSTVSQCGGLPGIYPDTLMAVDLKGRAATVRSGRVDGLLVHGNVVHPPTVMVRRQLLEESGDSDESLRYSSDYDLILRMARRARFAHVDAALLRYRRSPGQMSWLHAGHAMQLETVRILDKVAREAPDLAQREAPMIRRRKAESLVAAAGHVAASDRWRALRLLVRAARHQLLLGASTVTLGRMIIPPSMVPHLKHVARALFRFTVLVSTSGALAMSDVTDLALGS